MVFPLLCHDEAVTILPKTDKEECSHKRDHEFYLLSFFLAQFRRKINIILHPKLCAISTQSYIEIKFMIKLKYSPCDN